MDRKPLFRFSIATLLFLMLCLGGYLGGYRTGYNSGKQAADDAQLYVMTYPVGDLLAPGKSRTAAARYDPIIDQIVKTVAPGSWMENGAGLGEIQPFPSKKIIVVSQNRANHAKVKEYLDSQRQAKAKVASSSVK